MRYPVAYNLTQFVNNIMLQYFSRARRMLIIITSYEHPVMDFMWNKFCILSKAFHSGKELVQKIHVNGSNERITIGDESEKLDINFSHSIRQDSLVRERRRRKNLPESYYNYYCRECSSWRSNSMNSSLCPMCSDKAANELTQWLISFFMEFKDTVFLIIL